MTVEKVQRYLKNRYKFDKKLDARDLAELFDVKYKNFKDALKSSEKEKIRLHLAAFLEEILKYLNAVDMDLGELLQTELKINV